ncbi:hypothetical protein K1719_039854 [Acacia pycnantha]|nr:hypothetical protein K1719_039854 [Acacia pycnantha]
MVQGKDPYVCSQKDSLTGGENRNRLSSVESRIPSETRSEENERNNRAPGQNRTFSGSKTKNLQLSEWSVITQKLNERTIYNKYMSFRTYSRKRKAADGIAGTTIDGALLNIQIESQVKHEGLDDLLAGASEFENNAYALAIVPK